MNEINKHICYNCVSEPVLFDLIKTKGKRNRCNYCQMKVRCFSIVEISELIDKVFSTFYERTSEEPDDNESRLLYDRESDFFFERHGEDVIDVITELADIPLEAAKDIQECLAGNYYSKSAAEINEETEFAVDSRYELKSLSFGDWQHNWSLFENSLKFESRFFNRAGSEVLSKIFEGIGGLFTNDKRPLVVEAGPGYSISSLYRARVFQKLTNLRDAITYPDREIGPPPPRFATSGRMNAAGISTFYGATNSNVSIAEVRPPVGSYAVVACFSITRNIKLLDLTALKNVASLGSYFDKAFKSQVEKANFLRHLSAKMTMPVMPDDTAFDYLPTQAIADFLSNDSELEVDGIIFPSAQTIADYVNVVLFNKASRVKAMAYPKGTIIESTTEQDTEFGIEPNYEVQVWKPSSKNEDSNSDQEIIEAGDFDNRLVTLEVDSTTVRVHHITSVSFLTDENFVSRFEFENKDITSSNNTKANDW